MHDSNPTPPPPAGDDGQPNWQRDFFASLVVFLVALPLCIGIAVAVGVSPAKALISGIVGGIVAGFFAGSPLQVSGPAAGLFILVAEQLKSHTDRYLAQHPGWEQLAKAQQDALTADALEFAVGQLGISLMICGIIQVVSGRLGFGQWFRAVSPSVVHGMLAGIGILIILSQLHVMFDHVPLYEGQKAHAGWQYAFALPDACTTAFSGQGHHLHAVLIGVVSIAVIVAWQRLSFGWLKLLPGALVAVVLATLLAWYLNFGIEKLKVPDNLWDEFTWPSMTSLAGLLDPSVVIAGIMFALVAGAESLLCATAIDQMHTGERTNFDQELVAQGAGNFFCGLFGALPISGVIVRSSANVMAGAATRWSTILHGLWLLLFVVALPGLLGFIPKACLGAILVYTGFQLIKWEHIRHLWELDRRELGIYVITAFLIVVEDLLVGVAIGMILSAGKLLYSLSKLDCELITRPDSNQVTLKLEGSATFLKLPTLAEWLSRVPKDAHLTIDLRGLRLIDHVCLELISDWSKQHQVLGGTVTVDWVTLYARFHEAASEPSQPESPAEADKRELVSY